MILSMSPITFLAATVTISSDYLGTGEANAMIDALAQAFGADYILDRLDRLDRFNREHARIEAMRDTARASGDVAEVAP